MNYQIITKNKEANKNIKILVTLFNFNTIFFNISNRDANLDPSKWV